MAKKITAEAEQVEEKFRKTFYGTSSPNTCAYCFKHHLSLTPRQVKTRKCLERQCDALKLFDDHPYVQKREETKKKRKDRKAALEKKYLEVTHQAVGT